MARAIRGFPSPLGPTGGSPSGCRGASEIGLPAAFGKNSGLDLIQKSLFSALTAGAKVRLLVGDYLSITLPEALQHLLGWINYAGPAFEARLAEVENLRGAPDSFHTPSPLLKKGKGKWLT